MGRDWSLLHPELIQLIAEKIPFTNTYFRFRAVCRSWRLASSPKPPHISSFPWLELPQRTPTMSTLSFYDLSNSEIHRFELPFLPGEGLFFYAGRSSFLHEKIDRSVSLFNPITGEVKTDLIPSLSAPPTILGFASNEKTLNPLPSVNHQGYLCCVIQKVVITSSPFDENCFVVATFRSQWELGFCKIGDNYWTVLKLTEYFCGSRSILDFTCKKNLVYAINNVGHVTIYDLQNLSQNVMIANLNCSSRYDVHLVLGIEGELKGTPLAVKEIDYITENGRFEVYKCIYDELNRKHRWRRIKNIGYAVMLLDEKCGILSLDNFQLNGIEKNHICFYESNRMENCSSFEIKMTCIETGSNKEVRASLCEYRWREIPFWFTHRLY